MEPVTQRSLPRDNLRASHLSGVPGHRRPQKPRSIFIFCSILSPEIESQRVYVGFSGDWHWLSVLLDDFSLSRLLPWTRRCSLSEEPHQLGPHLRAAELRSGRAPSLSGVKPAWTDTLRHLISSPHSWDGTLPTPCVKQFKPDSSSSPLKIFAGLLDSRSLLFPQKHFATVQNPSHSWLLRANLRPPPVPWYIFNPSLIRRFNKFWLL